MSKTIDDQLNRWAADPHTKPEEIVDEYRSAAKDYDAHLTGHDFRAPKDGAEFFARHVPKDGAILDAGCGTGLTGLALRDAGYSNVVGSDISREMLDKAGEKGCYQELVECDLYKRSPFEDNSFDGVFAVAVFTHIDEPLAPFRELCRVTKPGGFILFNHRNDLYDKWEYPNKLAPLLAEGLWKARMESDYRLYIAEMPGYENIRTKYWIYEVL